MRTDFHPSTKNVCSMCMYRRSYQKPNCGNGRGKQCDFQSLKKKWSFSEKTLLGNHLYSYECSSGIIWMFFSNYAILCHHMTYLMLRIRVDNHSSFPLAIPIAPNDDPLCLRSRIVNFLTEYLPPLACLILSVECWIYLSDNWYKCMTRGVLRFESLATLLARLVLMFLLAWEKFLNQIFGNFYFFGWRVSQY